MDFGVALQSDNLGLPLLLSSETVLRAGVLETLCTFIGNVT